MFWYEIGFFAYNHTFKMSDFLMLIKKFSNSFLVLILNHFETYELKF